MEPANQLEEREQLCLEYKELFSKLRTTTFKEDSDFVNEYLVCVICMEIPKDPYACNICRKMICYKCLNGYMIEKGWKNRCVFKCDQEANLKQAFVIPNIFIMEILESSSFECKNG